MFKKTYFIAAVIALLSISCGSKSGSGFEISGKITGAENRKIILESMSFPGLNNPKFTVIDTARADKEGNFKIKNELPERMICRISVDGNRQNYYVVSVYDEKLKIDANLADMRSPAVEGSPATSSLFGLLDAIRKFDTIARLMDDSIVHLQATGMDSLADVITTKMRSDYFAIFKNYADSTQQVSNAVVALESLFDNDFDYVKSFAAKASGSKDSASLYVKELKEKVKLQEAVIAQSFIGKPIIDIVQPDPSGKELKLSDLKGKIVLIDFWASWCGPCRKENPNVVNVYNKYKSGGFTVFSVSLDDKKDAWMEAIKKDGLVWPTHVAAFNGAQNQAANDYHITGIPMNFLVNQDGIIVAQNLRGTKLDQEVRKLIVN